MQSFLHSIRTIFGVFLDALTLIKLCFRPTTVAAENLFLRWMTFVRNHAKAIIACDLFVVATATFQLTYVFLIMEIGTRRLLHIKSHRPRPPLNSGTR